MNKGIMRLAETHCKVTQSVSVLCTAEGRAFLACYNSSAADLVPFYPIHRHEELEVIVVRSGTASVFCNGKSYVASQGDVCIFPPFSMHAFRCLNSQSVAYSGLVFNFRLANGNGYFAGIDRFAAFFNAADVCSVVSASNDKDGRLSEAVRFICGSFEVNTDVATAVTDMLGLLQAYSLPALTDIAEQKRLHAVRQALDYIGVHHAEKFTVEELSVACGYSEFYMMKLFKKYVGMTVVDYANCLRLYHAEKMLRQLRPIADTARKVGFDNISYFNRQFKRLYGVTPTEFCRPFVKDTSAKV